MEQIYHHFGDQLAPAPITKPIQTEVQIGSLPINVMITVNTYVPGVVIIITWALSTYYGDTVPWPVMITDTASYYPQNILFRLGLLVPLFYWGVLCLLAQWWIRSGVQSCYGLGDSKPLSLEIVGYLSVICYGITISTIDQGQTATHLHGTCAVIFLILQMVYQVGTTIVLQNIRELNPEFISRWSLDRKLLICYVWVIPICAIIYEAIYDNQYGIALAEWVAVYQVIFYNHSFNGDLKHFKLAIDDEGFKLADLRKKIGYAEEFCVNDKEEEENDREQTTVAAPAGESRLRNNRPFINNVYHHGFAPNNGIVSAANNHFENQQPPVVGIPTYQNAPYVQTEMKNFSLPNNPLPAVSDVSNHTNFKQSAVAPGLYYMNPKNGQLFQMRNSN